LRIATPRTLVFSGESFLGGHLCQVLRLAGHDVTATAWAPADGSGLFRCDLTDAKCVEGIVAQAQPDHVIQCAGVTWTQEADAVYRMHVHGTLNVLDAVAKHAAHAPIVLLGSAAEYGDVPVDALPVAEDFPGRPTSFFGASKLAQTGVARAAAAQWALRIAVARPFNILGPGLPRHYFAASFAERLIRSRASGEAGDIPVMNADATRDFVDVRDVADALVALATSAAPPAGTMEVYNVASGRETAIGAVAAWLCRLAGGFRAVPAGDGASRSGISRSCGDGSKLTRVAHWRPRRTWETSIEDMWTVLASTTGP
jgi:GDP-4-dehydro-6-deoxy-D-mannose reductase